MCIYSPASDLKSRLSIIIPRFRKIFCSANCACFFTKNVYGSLQDTALGALERLGQNGTGGDVYDAMIFAAGLTYRAAVGKVMVVVTCDQVRVKSCLNLRGKFDWKLKVTNGWFYGDAITMLKEGMIRMHYVSPARLRLKQKKARHSDILGFTKDAVFTARNLNTAGGDLGLRSQLKLPKDYISTLATESGGSVFALDRLNSTYRDSKESIFYINWLNIECEWFRLVLRARPINTSWLGVNKRLKVKYIIIACAQLFFLRQYHIFVVCGRVFVPSHSCRRYGLR